MSKSPKLLTFKGRNRLTVKKIVLSFQKCLNVDPNRRSSCEKLLQHGYFDDYIAKQREFEIEMQNESSKSSNGREKSKVSMTSLPHLPTQGSQDASKMLPMVNTLKFSRVDHHLPTI